MEDNMCEEVAIKINWHNDVYCDDDIIWKLEDTKLPLDGKYKDEIGVIRHFKNGKYHNENGPSVIRKNRFEKYYINGEYHRIDGPAVIFSDGDHVWWLNDKYIENETMNDWLTENDIPLDWNTWTDLDKMMFALHWSDYQGESK